MTPDRERDDDYFPARASRLDAARDLMQPSIPGRPISMRMTCGRRLAAAASGRLAVAREMHFVSKRL